RRRRPGDGAQPALLDVGGRDGRQRGRGGHRQRGCVDQGTRQSSRCSSWNGP
ncbi:unnamed protein product, partial [Heterosigma akashiwo]